MRVGYRPVVLVADLRHMTAKWDSSVPTVLLVASVLSFFQPRVRAVMWVRASMCLWRDGHRLAAQWCTARAIRAAGVEIHPAAEIGPGLALAHSVGIVVGHDVRAGRDLVLHQGVTIGHGVGPGQPKLGDKVRIGAGAVLLGPIIVGDRVKIGANAVVLADVPADTTVVGLWK